MSLLFPDNLSRETADTRACEGSMSAFNRSQKATYMCTKCGIEFAAFTGIKRIKGTSLAKCPIHQQEQNARNLAKQQSTAAL